MRLPVPVLLAIALMLSACATIFTGTTDDITFETEPPGATIQIEGIDRGTTPATLEVTRPGLGNKEVTLRLDGYENRTFTLQKSFNAVSILNLGGLVGWIVDIATGSVTKYDPTSYHFSLDSAGSSALLEAFPETEHTIRLSDDQETVYVQSEGGRIYVFK